MMSLMESARIAGLESESAEGDLLNGALIEHYSEIGTRWVECAEKSTARESYRPLHSAAIMQRYETC